MHPGPRGFGKTLVRLQFHTLRIVVSGVKRAHLLDARLDGGLLLELYSRDGVGTMISTDFYEGE